MKFLTLLLILTAYVSTNINAQIKLNEYGFNDVQLGKNIKEVKKVLPFTAFRDKELFKVFPVETNFYVWQSSDSILFENIKIRYVFLSADTSGVILHISMWLYDPDYALESHLTAIYGESKFRVDSMIKSTKNRDILIWKLSPYISASMAQPIFADPVLNFPITKLDFIYPRDLDKIALHMIIPRSQHK